MQDVPCNVDVKDNKKRTLLNSLATLYAVEAFLLAVLETAVACQQWS